MKILYAVQATGNGHISRAITLFPYLSKYGKVEVFLSGNNSNLAPSLPIKFRSKGISLIYNKTGGLDYLKIATQRNPSSIWKEIKGLPVEKYDLILNDFDMITSMSCQLKNIPSVHFGHQASFQSKLTPRPPRKSWHGELLLKNYVKAPYHVGLHFKAYDSKIFGAIVKNEILEATSSEQGHITVYLPSHSPAKLFSIFSQIKEYEFEIFARSIEKNERIGNIHFQPIENNRFTKSLISCDGIICGAGFETPAEALHLGKKILAVPIKGQYEQTCNAAALKEMGINCLNEISVKAVTEIRKWLSHTECIKIDYSQSIENSLFHIFNKIVPNLSGTSIKDQFSEAPILRPILNNSTLA